MYQQVRSVWHMPSDEQTPPEPESGIKRWQAVALEEVQVNPLR